MQLLTSSLLLSRQTSCISNEKSIDFPTGCSVHEGSTPRSQSADRNGPDLFRSASHICLKAGAKSFIDDLILSKGFICSRAAILLRFYLKSSLELRFCRAFEQSVLRNSQAPFGRDGRWIPSPIAMDSIRMDSNRSQGSPVQIRQTQSGVDKCLTASSAAMQPRSWREPRESPFFFVFMQREGPALWKSSQ